MISSIPDMPRDMFLHPPADLTVTVRCCAWWRYRYRGTQGGRWVHVQVGTLLPPVLACNSGNSYDVETGEIPGTYRRMTSKHGNPMGTPGKYRKNDVETWESTRNPRKYLRMTSGTGEIPRNMGSGRNPEKHGKVGEIPRNIGLRGIRISQETWEYWDILLRPRL